MKNPTTTPTAADRFRAERDEARRMYCVSAARHSEYETPEDIADFRGWDCFKQETAAATNA
jgi:hypothetical protein